ncbi:zinc phosphodiesterase ELAC protein 1 [Pygocentrus nattereri]|uniref:Zinc phosphodiesterase ELAC protein 1 n=1 Tax=Pygocentrus nattereri TaxID=42514 RepID=A0AAR2JYW1_PYGNA|nr:zinc phosphodiesterase ELAC protein 1 [Pygocentrus nattereri]
MEVTVLGSGSAFPGPLRGCSAVVLRLPRGDCWLFDCGEGTQTQLMRSSVRAGKISKIFISHLHGDHMYGLPGLLCTLSLNCSVPPGQQGERVEIFGPVGLRLFLRVALRVSSSELMFPFTVHELEPTRDQSPPTGLLDPELTACCPQHHPQEQPGRTVRLDVESNCYTLIEDEQVVVKAFRLCHRVPSFGFSIQERDQPGRLRVELLKEMGLKPGPLFGRLKNGESVTLEDGRVLGPSEVLEPATRGRKVCVLGDCSGAVGEGVHGVCEGADMLVHEATLEDGLQEKAVEHGHSTPSMAAAVARDCGAHTLLLTHFSQRYKPAGGPGGTGDDVLKLKRQAELALQGTNTCVILAEDFLSLPIPLRKHLAEPDGTWPSLTAPDRA